MDSLRTPIPTSRNERRRLIPSRCGQGHINVAGRPPASCGFLVHPFGKLFGGHQRVNRKLVFIEGDAADEHPAGSNRHTVGTVLSLLTATAADAKHCALTLPRATGRKYIMGGTSLVVESERRPDGVYHRHVSANLKKRESS